MPGAIRLASEAALRSGAALVAVHCHPQNRLMVTNGRPELMLTNEKKGEVIDTKILSRAKAIVCGPGLGREQWGQKLFESVITQNVHLVLDADALHFLSLPKYNMCNNHWVLTPHEGEAAKLLGISREEVAQDRYGCVKKIATQYGGICVLKGAGSLISDGDTVWVNSSGNAGMASGGMGDVLSGTIAALLMQMPDNYEATRLAVYIHGRAADIIAAKNGQVGILASDLYSTIQYLLNEEV